MSCMQPAVPAMRPQRATCLEDRQRRPGNQAIQAGCRCSWRQPAGMRQWRACCWTRRQKQPGNQIGTIWNRRPLHLAAEGGHEDWYLAAVAAVCWMASGPPPSSKHLRSWRPSPGPAATWTGGRQPRVGCPGVPQHALHRPCALQLSHREAGQRGWAACNREPCCCRCCKPRPPTPTPRPPSRRGGCHELADLKACSAAAVGGRWAAAARLAAARAVRPWVLVGSAASGTAWLSLAQQIGYAVATGEEKVEWGKLLPKCPMPDAIKEEE